MNDLNALKKPILEKFLHYVGYNTQSKMNIKNIPSTLGQRKIGTQLKEELIALGLQDIEVTKQGILTAYLPSNVNEEIQTIGFITHLDTSPNCNSKNTHPEVIVNYRGGDISLGNGDEFISPVHYPLLQRLVGTDLVVSDGKNLLGLNKASIAEIMMFLSYVQQNNIPHCNLRVAFIPDKETRLDHSFPLESFPCDAIFYLESGRVGEFALDSFYSADILVTIYGRSMNTGYGNKTLRNALALACEFQQQLPQEETPEKTAEREGFYHLKSLTGNLDKAELCFSICDFDKEKFKQREDTLIKLVDEFNHKKRFYKKITIEIEERNRNGEQASLGENLAQKLAYNAIEKTGIKAKLVPFRGMSICENIIQQQSPYVILFTGGENLYSRQEFITLEDMVNTTKILLALVKS